jgi:hypothetical protein
VNLSLFKFKAATEPVWVVQGLSALVSIAAAVAGGDDWRSYIPALLTALSAPLLRSRVVPIQRAADLANIALHTPAPGGGVQIVEDVKASVKDAEAVIKDVRAAAAAAGLTTSTPSGPTVLPPQH